MLLAEYNIVYTPHKAIKGSKVTGHLAEHAISDPDWMLVDFPDESIMNTVKSKVGLVQKRWVMKFDGALNSLGQSVGVVFISPEGKVCPITAKICFDCTIDYFTKWVEAVSYANITKSVVTKFIKKEIIF